ncbi:MAG TPA: MFS transporter [bacterium]|nr:MFS transporter [bacterium]
MVNTGEQKKAGDLTLGQTFAYAAGVIPASYSPALIVGWLMYFYYPGEGKGTIYMGLGAFVVVQFIGRLMDSVSDPLVGYFSDQTRSRWGRRIPYIIFGTPFVALTMALMWYPLTDHPSMANNLWLAGNLLVFWLAYTVVVAPHLSLLPEIAPGTKERNKVGGWLGVGDVIGMLLGAAVFGMVIGAVGKMPDGLHLGPLHFPDGFKFVGVVSAAGILVLFYLTWWFIREKPHDASKEVQFNFYRAVRETLKNPTYPHYLVMIALLRMLVDLIFVLLPYYVTRRLHLGEGFAGALSGAIIVGAVIFFPLVIWGANRYGKKRVFSLGLLTFSCFIPLCIAVPFLPLAGDTARMAAAVGVFALLAPGAAAFIVLQRVIITDIMDFDEKITGYRREAMYNGIEGLITKFAAGVAPMIAALNFALFRMDTGILTAFAMDALITLCAYLIFRPYPIEK